MPGIPRDRRHGTGSIPEAHEVDATPSPTTDNGRAQPGGDENLSTVLVQNGLLTEAQFAMARVYAQDHRCDLCQAILELNLIPPDRLNTLAFERIVALSRGETALGPGSLLSLQPDRAKIERDIRAELKASATTATPPDLLD